MEPRILLRTWHLIISSISPKYLPWLTRRRTCLNKVSATGKPAQHDNSSLRAKCSKVGTPENTALGDLGCAHIVTAGIAHLHTYHKTYAISSLDQRDRHAGDLYKPSMTNHLRICLMCNLEKRLVPSKRCSRTHTTYRRQRDIAPSTES
jgi:hypothetical protein